MGLRNSYDLAFNRRGDLFTYDSDLENDFGLPNYRPTAIRQVPSGTDSGWGGPCTELARARRVEWALANQATGACFQRCDVSSGKAVNSRSYIELGPALDLAVVDDSNELLRSLNVDAPPHPQVDGIIGAATLAGTRLHLDYAAQPLARGEVLPEITHFSFERFYSLDQLIDFGDAATSHRGSFEQEATMPPVAWAGDLGVCDLDV